MKSSTKIVIKVFAIIFLVILASCKSDAGDIYITATSIPIMTVELTSTQTQSPMAASTATPSPTLPHTSTLIPTDTPTPSPSPTKTMSPSITPTYDARLAVTHTPESAAQCPQETSGTVPTFDYDPNMFCLDIQSQVLEFLNAGGQRQYVINEFDATETDLTNDGVPELAITECSFRVYSCVDGQYQTVLNLPGREGFNYIFAIEDLNLNGVPELVLVGDVGPFGSASTLYYQILEWNGQQFGNLVNHPDFRSPYGGGGIDGGWIYSDGIGQDVSSIWDNASLMDIDGNGTIEFVMNSGLPTSYDWMINGGPTRAVTQLYMWNGTAFNLEGIQIADPEFRFQAVQDADHASLVGDHARAFELYQQVRLSDELDWWSVAKATQEASAITAEIQGVVTPTPLPKDETERSNLSAYAYYRMMLLHVVNNHQAEAENSYNTLLENFAEGEAGYSFAELATIFWTEYQLSKNIQTACLEAIKYADENQATTIELLGSAYHGWQSRSYKPEDICPFK